MIMFMFASYTLFKEDLYTAPIPTRHKVAWRGLAWLGLRMNAPDIAPLRSHPRMRLMGIRLGMKHVALA